MGTGVVGIGGAICVHYPGSIALRVLFDINFKLTIIGPMAGAFFLTFLLEDLRRFLPRGRTLLHLIWYCPGAIHL